jgi:predicted DNA-binding WGR domain protein
VHEFWEISVEGSTITTRFGKVGVTGQTAIKQFDSRGEAIVQAEKLINEKTKMGYVEK